MSGSTIGGVVGGVIGFYVGGPTGAQYGFMIGSAVGGAVDPEKIQGPKLTDPQRQTSNEGVPRGIVYGTAAVLGNVIQCQSVPTEHKHTEGGKGGGPVQETFTYTRTVAIRICEAAPLGGEMKLRRVWVNGKLAYDVSGTGSIDADSAAFLAGMTFYSGSETQLPNADLEALPAEDGGGVGNVPAYRGTCYAVLRDVDVTQGQGALPVFRWEVCSDAEVGAATDSYSAKKFAYGNFPWLDDAPDQTDPRRSDVTYEYAYWPLGGSEPTTWYPTVDQAIVDSGRTIIDSAKLMGWSTVYYGHGTDGDHRIAPWQDITTDTWDWSTAYTLGLIYSRYVGDGDASASIVIYQAGGTQMQCSLYLAPQWGASLVGSESGSEIFGNATVVNATGAPAGNDNTWSCYNSGDYVSTGLNIYTGFAIACRPVLACVDVDPDTIAAPDASGVYVSLDGDVTTHGTCTVVSGTFKQLQRFSKSGVDVSTLPYGPVLDSTDPNYSSESYWTAAYAVEQAAGNMDAGLVYGVDYPVAVTSACLCDDILDVVTPNTVPLDEVVGDLITRAGVTDYDVSALASDTVNGYAITQPTDAAGAIRVLQQVYFFDLPEWGNSGETGTKLRAVKRGGASALTLSDDDLVDVDDDEDTRAQSVEFPRKLNFLSPDPDLSYEVTKQTAERVSENVKAISEANVSTPVIFTPDQRAQIADILLKTAWEEAAGRSIVTVPEEFSGYVTSDIITRNAKRYRIDRVQQADGTSRWELTRDRASAYSSNATAGTSLTPPTPAGSARGPTLCYALNLPSLRSSENVPGIHVGVCGLLPGWNGADIYLSVDGGVTEQLVTTILDPATMGTLSADMATGDVTLSVSLYNDDELDTITTDQIAARLNGVAITSAGVSEVLQFQTATDTGTKTYDLTDLTRGELGTTDAAHIAGDGFLLLDQAVAFIPVDVAHAGETIIVRAVSRGTVPANNDTVSLVFDPPTFVIDAGTTL